MRIPRFFIALMGIAELLFASPPAKASATIAGKRITIKYGAPSIRGRQVFGDAGLLSKDWTYPVWRAGANAATSLITDADLDMAGVHVPAGTYSLYVLVKDADNWKLIVNRQTGQGGHIYNARMDLCRVDLKMDRPNTPVEKLRYTITTTGNTGTIQLEWENHVASVPIRAT
jgi:Protein of unknown function (DUF2911)